MAHPTTFNVRLSEQLGAFVASNIGDDGRYGSASEYFRDLVCQDQARTDEQRFQALKAELQAAFAAPDSAFEAITAEEFIARAKSRMA